MKPVIDLAGKKVLVVGLARTGIATALFCAERGAIQAERVGDLAGRAGPADLGGSGPVGVQRRGGLPGPGREATAHLSGRQLHPAEHVKQLLGGRPHRDERGRRRDDGQEAP